MGEELSKRNLRFHYGGNLREIGRVGSMLHMYTGGEVVDSKDWDGDEVCLMDLVKEVYKLISIPECCKVKLWWFWLFRKEGYANQRLLLGEDIDVMFLWENAKPDKENCIHLYVEVENKSQVASTCANSSVPPKPLSNINNSEFQLSPVKRSSQICKDELRIQVIQGGSKEINLNRSSNLI